ncbi:MAG: hypothetical protein WAJ96_15645 [Candidatus Acidiferrum sp.]
MKLSLLIGAFFLSVSSANAQNSCKHGPASTSSQNFQMSGLGGGAGGGGEIGTAGGGLTYEPPRDFKVSYVTNDGEYVPSNYMNYDDALALGRHEIAASEEMAKNRSNSSLGEVARAYRAAKERPQELEAKVVQADAERIDACSATRNCHR